MNDRSLAHALRDRWHRRGLSMLEVILALAILATAAAMLSQLLHIAIRSASMARDEPRATMWCENRLEEIAAGFLPAESAQDAPLPEDNEWIYSVDTQAGPYPGLLTVTVTVTRGSTTNNTATVTLSRWIVDPDDQRFVPDTTSTSESSSSSGTTSSGGP